MFRDYFGAIEKGITDRRQEKMLQGIMEKLNALEGGRVLRKLHAQNLLARRSRPRTNGRRTHLYGHPE